MLLLAIVSGAALTGCAGAAPTTVEETTPTVGARMAGPVIDIQVTQEALASKPAPVDLKTPESAIRSYLAWTSYAYRTAQSVAAQPAMTGPEYVRVDAYVQFNIQQYRMIDQTLDSLKLGTPTITADGATVTAKEKWTYRYVSVKTAGEVLEGPYPASYDATYTLTKSADDAWLVDSVQATALGTVK